MNFLQNISLKQYNTFGIDVIASDYIEVKDSNEVSGLIQEGVFSARKHLILGGGSNVLFVGDFDGCVIKNMIMGLEVEEVNSEEVIVTAGAGMEWDELVWYCIDHGFGGIENLSKIPGKVGAAPIQNIGAYGVELKDAFYELKAIDLDEGSIKTYGAKECNFGYRDSIFKKELKGKVMILTVSLKLSRSKDPNTSYGAIEDELKNMGITDRPDIRSVGMAVSRIRERKLPDPDECGNAGSFFKNPVVDEKKYSELCNLYTDMPSYKGKEGMVKIPAGWLIEQCGWKGKRIRNAGVHENQALVLVNHGGATGAEILDLANQISNSVEERFGIILDKEVNVIKEI